MFDFLFVRYLPMFDFWFFGFLLRNVNAALVTGLLAAAACPDQLRKVAAGRWVVGAPWLEKQTNKQNVSSFLSTLSRLYKLIWEQLNWPFPASAHIIYGIYVYMFKISQIKMLIHIYLFCVLANDRVTNWQSGQYQCWSHGNKSSWGIGPLRIDLRIPRKLNILMFLYRILLGVNHILSITPKLLAFPI